MKSKPPVCLLNRDEAGKKWACVKHRQGYATGPIAFKVTDAFVWGNSRLIVLDDTYLMGNHSNCVPTDPNPGHDHSDPNQGRDHTDANPGRDHTDPSSCRDHTDYNQDRDHTNPNQDRAPTDPNQGRAPTDPILGSRRGGSWVCRKRRRRQSCCGDRVLPQTST